jgi:hypothetical protein
MPPMSNDTQPSALPRNHMIIVGFNKTTDEWNYVISPPQSNAKKARVRRKDRLQWISADGDLTVFFKGLTPLEDPDGVGIASVSAASGKAAGGIVATKPKTAQEFSYGVKLVQNGSGETVVDDPDIVIEE